MGVADGGMAVAVAGIGVCVTLSVWVSAVEQEEVNIDARIITNKARTKKASLELFVLLERKRFNNMAC